MAAMGGGLRWAGAWRRLKWGEIWEGFSRPGCGGSGQAIPLGAEGGAQECSMEGLERMLASVGVGGAR